MADNAPLVGKLRDIHLPDPVSFFPLPLAWWVVIFIVFCALVSIIYFFKYTRKRMLRCALTELDALESQLGQHNVDVLMAVGVLMKRYAKQQFPRSRVAPLWGEPWLAFLRKTSPSGQFDGTKGEAVMNLPYQRGVSHEEAALLFGRAREWLLENPHRSYRQIRI